MENWAAEVESYFDRMNAMEIYTFANIAEDKKEPAEFDIKFKTAIRAIPPTSPNIKKYLIAERRAKIASQTSTRKSKRNRADAS